MRSPCCLCVFMCIAHCQLLNAWTNLYETCCVYHYTWAHLNGIFHENLSSVSVSVSPCIVARQRFGKHVATATNTRYVKRTVGSVIFYAVRVHTKGESVGHFMYPPADARQRLGKHVPAAKGVVGGVISYAVSIVWKEVRQVIARNSCWFIYEAVSIVDGIGGMESKVCKETTSMWSKDSIRINWPPWEPQIPHTYYSTYCIRPWWWTQYIPPKLRTTWLHISEDYIVHYMNICVSAH
jgi:hypothetical protein